MGSCDCEGAADDAADNLKGKEEPGQKASVVAARVARSVAKRRSDIVIIMVGLC